MGRPRAAWDRIASGIASLLQRPREHTDCLRNFYLVTPIYREVPNLSHCGYSFVGGLGGHKTLATPVPSSKQQPTLPPLMVT